MSFNDFNVSRERDTKPLISENVIFKSIVGILIKRDILLVMI